MITVTSPNGNGNGRHKERGSRITSPESNQAVLQAAEPDDVYQALHRAHATGRNLFYVARLITGHCQLEQPDRRSARGLLPDPDLRDLNEAMDELAQHASIAIRELDGIDVPYSDIDGVNTMIMDGRAVFTAIREIALAFVGKSWRAETFNDEAEQVIDTLSTLTWMLYDRFRDYELPEQWHEQHKLLMTLGHLKQNENLARGSLRDHIDRAASPKMKE